MSSTYLTKVVTDVVDANGNANVTLSPAVGEFWAVSMVRVGTSTQPQFNNTASYPYCAIFLGAPNLMDGTTFLDDTTLGSGDVSSVISASIVIFGEAISALWENANPGDNAQMVIYGRSYDSLVELQSELAPVPGVRFAGTTGNASVWQYVGFQDNVGGNLNTNVPTVNFPLNAVFELISVKITVNTSSVAGNRYIGVRLTMPVGTKTIDVMATMCSQAQGASSTVAYSYAQGLNDYNANARVGTALPQRVIVNGGSTMTVIGSGLMSGDTWNTFNVTYRQYTSFTKVAFS